MNLFGQQKIKLDVCVHKIVKHDKSSEKLGYEKHDHK